MTTRTCPGCTAPMRTFDAGKVELERCTFCNGLWFDGGELEQVLGRRSPAKLDPMKTSRKCPVCAVGMRAAEVGGLRVEFCETCHGVFLDDGELRAMNGGQQVRVQVSDAKAAARPEAQVKDDVMGWLDSLSR